MKKNILVILFLMLIPVGLSFPGDDIDIYGDYLLASMEKTISLDLEGAKLVDVLKLFSTQTGLNFVAAEEARDKLITLYMQDTPLKEAMDIIFEINNLTYDYRPAANIFVVKEPGNPDIETKIYHLKNARVTNSPIKSKGGEGMVIKDVVANMMSSNGKLMEDPVTNSLVIRDVSSQFSQIEELINALDVSCPKVMIEVEILDVSRRFVDELGMSNASSGLSGTISDIFTKFYLNQGHILPPFRTAAIDFSSYTAALKLLHTEATTKILARPKILTLSGEAAEIGITTDEVVGTIRDTETVEGGGATTSTVTADRAETGVSLKVTPIVNLETKEITISLEPSIKTAKASSFSDELGNEFNNIEEASTKSLVKLKSGQTLLIGGLIKHQETDSRAKIPFFSQIPFLGAFFRGKDSMDDDRELLIFLTPHIAEEGTVLAKREMRLRREQINPFRRRTIGITLDKFSQ
ncbi:MAG: hypothetical protein KKC11_02435 [Candidatus Omnitrophica bacterium]|nr:hypothetical protein [Candidatus Omnitrophota bacterium]MBU1133462.1 hypothetical protein [Candidatus Omnitrophota bacterium]MBU1809518.1 hypothetical protein [Candidatus Omnitrophota bacterium]